jgi:hypothetical protein
VGPVGVVVVDVFGEEGFEVASAGDEQPVGALAADAADPPLGDRVRCRCLHRGADDPGADRGEHRVEGGRELGVPVPDQEFDRLCSGPVLEVVSRLRACWSTQVAVGGSVALGDRK